MKRWPCRRRQRVIGEGERRGPIMTHDKRKGRVIDEKEGTVKERGEHNKKNSSNNCNEMEPVEWDCSLKHGHGHLVKMFIALESDELVTFVCPNASPSQCYYYKFELLFFVCLFVWFRWSRSRSKDGQHKANTYNFSRTDQPSAQYCSTLSSIWVRAAFANFLPFGFTVVRAKHC